jgi:hypothetical protein
MTRVCVALDETIYFHYIDAMKVVGRAMPGQW